MKQFIAVCLVATMVLSLCACKPSGMLHPTTAQSESTSAPMETSNDESSKGTTAATATEPTVGGPTSATQATENEPNEEATEATAPVPTVSEPTSVTQATESESAEGTTEVIEPEPSVSEPTSATQVTENEPTEGTTAATEPEPTVDEDALLLDELRAKAEIIVEHLGLFDSTEQFKTPPSINTFWMQAYRLFGDPVKSEEGSIYSISLLDKASQYFFGISCDWTQVHYMTQELRDTGTDYVVVELKQYYGAALDAVIVPCAPGSGYSSYRFKLQSIEKSSIDTYTVIYKLSANGIVYGTRHTGYAYLTFQNSPYGYVATSFVDEWSEESRAELEIMAKASDWYSSAQFYCHYFDSPDAFFNSSYWSDFWKTYYWGLRGSIGTYFDSIDYEYDVSILDEMSLWYFGKTFDWSQVDGYDAARNVIASDYYTWIGGKSYDYKPIKLEKVTPDTYVITLEVSKDYESGIQGYAYMTMVNSPYGYVVQSYTYEEAK